MNKYVLIFITVPNEGLALKIARALIEKKLAACVNITPKIKSIYSWQDKICEDDEFLMLVKSKEEVFEELKQEVVNLHTYDIPEIIMINIENGLRNYLNWIDQSVNL